MPEERTTGITGLVVYDTVAKRYNLDDVSSDLRT